MALGLSQSRGLVLRSRPHVRLSIQASDVDEVSVLSTSIISDLLGIQTFSYVPNQFEEFYLDIS